MLRRPLHETRIGDLTVEAALERPFRQISFSTETGAEREGDETSVSAFRQLRATDATPPISGSTPVDASQTRALWDCFGDIGNQNSMDEVVDSESDNRSFRQLIEDD